MIGVVGASGTVGSAVLRGLQNAGIEAVGFAKTPKHGLGRIDLADRKTWDNFPADAEAVLVSAGMSDLRTCRTQPAETRKVNVEGTADFVRFVSSRGCFPAVISSSYVFDGSRPGFSTTDAVSPLCEYGKQKADLEMNLKELGANCAVVRLSKVFGESNRLLCAWRDVLRQGGEIRAADDARLSPLSPSFAAEAIIPLLRGRHGGLWHLSASDDLSWFEIAAMLAERCGAPGDAVERAKLLEIDSSAEFVPRHGSLKVNWPEAIDIPRSVLAVRELLENICATN